MSLARKSITSARLYGILDLDYVRAEDALSTAQQLVDGGVDILQLRAKNEPLETIDRLAEPLLEICRGAGTPFIINDFPEIAARIGADGVHVGQDDGEMQAVRSIVGSESIVGRSTHSVEQAAVAAADPGTDYIGFGPLFPTATKPGRPAIGLNDIKTVHSAHPELPIFCIGGVKLENLETIVEAGARRVVIVSGILQAANMEKYISEVLSLIAES